MKPHAFWFAVLTILAALFLPVLPVDADELHLQSGSVLNGKLIAADERSIVFKTADSLLTKSRDEVRMIVLGGREIKVGALPPGVSVTQGLTVRRWATFRRITNFQRGADAKFINNSKISADGSKIIFSTYSGTYVINADGSSLVRLSDKRNNGFIDISADAKNVTWYNAEEGLMVANSDGAGRLKMPGGLQVDSLRMTARGDLLVVLAGGNISTLPTDGSGIKRVVSTEQAAKVAGTDANGNFWRGWPSGLDMSDDGSRIVFHFLWDAFAVGSDGGGLRKLTDFGRTDDRSLGRVRISGDGRRVAYYNSRNESSFTVVDWDGGNRLDQAGAYLNSGEWMQMSRDGAKALISWGLRIFDGNGKGRWNVDDIGGVWGAHPLTRVRLATASADFKRVCVEIESAESVDQGRPSQLVVVDFDPPTLNGAIPMANIDISPRFLINDGSTQAGISAQITDPNLQYAGVMPMRAGLRLADWNYGNLPMKKPADKAKGSDNIFESDPLRMQTNSGKPVPPGPLSMRVFSVSKEGHVFMLEMDGFEARLP